MIELFHSRQAWLRGLGITLLVTLSLTLSACGKKGPLTLPDKHSKAADSATSESELRLTHSSAKQDTP